MRIYKVASMTRMVVLDESSEYPPRFDLRAEWPAAVVEFERGLLNGAARLRVAPQGIVRLDRLSAVALEQACIGAPDARR